MKRKKKTIQTLDEFKDKHYGVEGTRFRDELEKGYEEFRLGTMLYKARLEKGMTQAELARKSGTTKSYISKIENNINCSGANHDVS